MKAMLKPFFIFAVLMFASCASVQRVGDRDLLDLLNSLPAEGEGRGRMSINQHQYLFSYEAALKDSDWVLGVSIPIHGEEVLILPDLRGGEAPGLPGASFNSRIESDITNYLYAQEQSRELASSFMRELRHLMRLVLHRRLGLNPKCDRKNRSSNCVLDDEVYELVATDQQLRIKKSITPDYDIELVGEILTDSFFKRSSFFLHSRSSKRIGAPVLALELFWN